jgi:DDE superfamily endonuclease
MVFTTEDKVAIKFLRENKRYGAKRFLAEFPSKQWSLSGLKWLLKKIDETGSIERSKGAGRPRSIRCDDNVERVEHLVLSQEDKPGTHLTQREIAHETGISQRTVGRILKNDLQLRCFKKHRATELTEANKLARLHRARQLLNKYPASRVNFIVFTDEKVFTVARPTNSQNDRVYARVGTAKKQVATARLLRTRATFSRSLMVSVGVSALGTTSIHFIEPGVKVNGQYYREVLLMDKLLPDIRQLSEFYVFQQDSAPAHRARETVDLLTRETPEFIPPTLWPPNSPDLNPVDYKVWSVMQEKVYKERIKDVDELRSRILTAWDEMDQRVIDTAVRQWRTRLRACVKAKGGHFEHKLSK